MVEATRVTHGTAARRVLWAAVAAAQARDPLAPVTVAVPSSYAGLALRRELGAAEGLVNVRFLALARVAELLGAPALAATGRSPLTGPLRTEAVHRALLAEPGPLAAVAHHPSTDEALARSFRDLRRAPPDTVARLRARGGRAAMLTAAYERFREATAGFYDEEDLAEAAADAARAGTVSVRELGHLLLFTPLGASPAEAALVEALATGGRASIVLGLTGDPAVDRVHTTGLGARLGSPGGDAPTVDAPAGPPAGTSVVSAPDPDDEVRAAVRLLMARAGAGIPLHRMAVVFQTPEPYARLVPEVLGAAGIPWNGPSPRRLADTTVGRVLLGVLDLAERDFARDSVAEWLVTGPILDPADGRPVDAARWDVVSREAGVVGGAAQWDERLARVIATIDRELATRDDDAPEWRVRRLEGDREQVARLRAFMADLVAHVEAPQPATWPRLVEWVTGLVPHYLGPETRRARWPDEELDAARRVDDAVRELAGLDAIEPVTEPGRFRRAVEAALDAPAARVGTFGTGVLVGQLRHAYGTSLDTIFVLGMAEGSFPPRGREDPLLPDRTRAAVGDLAIHADRWLEERRDYLGALAAADERVLSFPRADPRAQRKRLPARWLLETARALHGGELSAEQLRNLTRQPWLHVVESFEQGVVSDGDPGSVPEYDLRSLRTWRRAGRRLSDHALVSGSLADGFSALAARGSPGFTEHDGLVADRAALVVDRDHPVSPTALQDWAVCPFRYLLARVLRLREVPRPEAVETISALDKGALVHAVLEEFVGGSPRRGPGEPWTADHRARLRSIAERHCREAEARGLTGRKVLWTLARREILQTVEQFADYDEHLRAEHGVAPVPDGLELGFGLDGAPAVEIALGGGRRVAFRGRIDRLDVSPDGRRAVVYDYKTGSAHRYGGMEDDPVAAGALLQLPVYAHAALARDGVEEVGAYYWFVRDSESVGYELDAERDARFVDVVGSVVAGIGEGCFPAYPGEPSWDPRAQRDAFDNCRFCAFDRVCPNDRGITWDRKRQDPAIESFRSLLPDEEPDRAGAT